MIQCFKASFAYCFRVACRV